jgi:hypothetical protein
MVATLVARNANEDMVAPMVGVCRILRLAGVWSQVVVFCVGAFDRNLTSVAVKMFSHLIYLKKAFYKFCTFNAICKDNAAINYITVLHKKRLIPVNFDGSYNASFMILEYVSISSSVIG